MLIAFEARLLLAAARRIVRERSRRTAWAGVAVVACVASVIDVATANDAQRDLGIVRIAPPVAAAAVLAILILAAATGARSARPYGLHGADPIWWRYAGIARRRAERWTAVVSVGYTALAFGAVALLLGTAFALAAPEHATIIAAFAGAATCTAALSRAVALACTHDADVTAAPRIDRSGERRPQPAVPPGGRAARWLVAIRRSEPLVPFASVAWGAGAGAVAALAATRLNGQLVSLIAVIAPMACALGDAMQGSAGSETLRSGWWRTAFGTQPQAVVAWSIAASLRGMLLLAGGALGLGWGLGALGAGIVFLPTCVLALPVHRLLCLAVDAGCPAALDRAGPGAAARATAVAATAAALVALVWSCGRAGIGAMAGVADFTLVLIGLVAARITTQRLAV